MRSYHGNTTAVHPTFFFLTIPVLSIETSTFPPSVCAYCRPRPTRDLRHSPRPWADRVEGTPGSGPCREVWDFKLTPVLPELLETYFGRSTIRYHISARMENHAADVLLT